MNIAVEATSNFDDEAWPLCDIYSELTTAEGRVFFEGPGLISDPGFDLMDCPLDFSFKLQVRRGTTFFQVALPLSMINTHLMKPPFEWKGWVSLLPKVRSQSCADGMMFQQAVHFMNSPTSPRFLLRLRYHNLDLEAQHAVSRGLQEQESREREEADVSKGKALFAEIRSLVPPRPAGARNVARSSASVPLTTPEPYMPIGILVYVPVAMPLDSSADVPPTSLDDGTREAMVLNDALADYACDASQLRAGLQGALRCINSVRDILDDLQPPGGKGCDGGSGGSGFASVPPALDESQLLASRAPGKLLDHYGQQLSRCLSTLTGARTPPCGDEALGGQGRMSTSNRLRRLFGEDAPLPRLPPRGRPFGESPVCPAAWPNTCSRYACRVPRSPARAEKKWCSSALAKHETDDIPTALCRPSRSSSVQHFRLKAESEVTRMRLRP